MEGRLYDTFQQLQDDGHLNPLNKVDVYCLHHVFLLRINSALKSFIELWNNHPICTEHNCTPNQLFIEGALQQPTCGVHQQPGGTNLPANHDPVEVPRSSFTPCTVLKRDVDHVNTLRNSNDFRMDIYHEIVGIVGQHLTRGCSSCYAGEESVSL